MKKYLLILFLMPSVCFSETSLWQVSKNGYELYLGGTIHALKKEDYPLPVEFNEAFNISDKLVLEANIEMAQTPEFTQKMLQMMTYPPGQTLRDSINEKTFNSLEQYLAERSVPIEVFLGYKPAMVVLMLNMIELQKMGMVDIGVDQYFQKKAKQAGKDIDYFESVDEQMAFLGSMGQGNVDELILSTIDDMNRMESMLAVIKSAWLRGDADKLAEVTLAEMVRDYPEVYQTLLVQRNNNWMPGIERMLANEPVEMVLVGALHLVGSDGLLQQLRNRGYTVKPYRH